MDYIARLNQELDEKYMQEDIEEYGACIIDKELYCNECGMCQLNEEVNSI